MKSLVRGTVHLPDGDGYHEARQVWNGMIDRRPAAIVCAAGVAEVMAVRLAGERRLPVAIRCGGHNVAGTSVGDGEHRHRSCAVQGAPGRSCAKRAQAAAFCGANTITRRRSLGSPHWAAPSLPPALRASPLAAATATCSRRYGMTCDNPLSADVVKASGELGTTCADSHPDLFWALRGGGGTSGGDVARISTSSAPGAAGRFDCVSVPDVENRIAAIPRPESGSE